MITAVLHTSGVLDLPTFAAIEICCEEAIPVIYSTKKRPWTKEGVYFAEAQIFDFDIEIAATKEPTGHLPEIRLIVTIPHSKQLYRECDERTAMMVAALQAILPKDSYQICVVLRLTGDVAAAASGYSKVPDIAADSQLNEALDNAKRRISEEVIVADEELISTS